MVSEVVDHRDAPYFTPHFHPALHAQKGPQSFTDTVAIRANGFGRGYHRENVAHAEGAGERSLDLAPLLIGAKHPKGRAALGEADISRMPVLLTFGRLRRRIIVDAVRKRLHWGEGLGRQLAGQRRVPAGDHYS